MGTERRQRDGPGAVLNEVACGVGQLIRAAPHTPGLCTLEKTNGPRTLREIAEDINSRPGGSVLEINSLVLNTENLVCSHSHLLPFFCHYISYPRCGEQD